MSKETLTVRNFGPIKEADLDLRKVTVFIGEQASGKSCLAKLLAILSDKFAPQGLIDANFKDYQLAAWYKNQSDISYYNDNYQITVFNKKFENLFNTQKAIQLIQGIAAARKKFFELQATFEAETDEPKKKELYAEWDFWGHEIRKYATEINENFIQATYVPAERSLVSILQPTTRLANVFRGRDNYDQLAQFNNLYNEAKKNLPNFKVDFLDLSFDGASNLVKSKNGNFDLNESSSGIQAVIPIGLTIEHNLKERNINKFIIEEPELNLYPTTQKKLVEYLIEKCTKGDNRLVITTHSPYILTALNNCIEASNVRKSNPEAAAEVDKLVPRESQIDFEDVAAYFVGGGTARSIMNQENQLIDANALDEISEEIGRTFDQLLDLKYQNQD